MARSAGARGQERVHRGSRVPEVVGRFRGQYRNAQDAAGDQDARASTASAATIAVAIPPAHNRPAFT